MTIFIINDNFPGLDDDLGDNDDDLEIEVPSPPPKPNGKKQ